MKSIYSFIVLACFAASSIAHADGGVVTQCQDNQGASVTIFQKSDKSLVAVVQPVSVIASHPLFAYYIFPHTNPIDGKTTFAGGAFFMSVDPNGRADVAVGSATPGGVILNSKMLCR